MVGLRLQGQAVTLTPCHADVSPFNIIVSDEAVGLVDLDDCRFDMPALDLSQSLLQIDAFSRCYSLIALPRFKQRAVGRLLQGYGRELPEGEQFWVPHLWNLAVFVLTLARRRRGLSPSRITDELHYARLRAELAQSVDRILRSKGRENYLRRA
jgi:Ser/Thr protein kinase RdoA (MazF antagonist)